MIIAVDGPSASGKGTLARRLAELSRMVDSLGRSDSVIEQARKQTTQAGQAMERAGAVRLNAAETSANRTTGARTASPERAARSNQAQLLL